MFTLIATCAIWAGPGVGLVLVVVGGVVVVSSFGGAFQLLKIKTYNLLRTMDKK